MTRWFRLRTGGGPPKFSAESVSLTWALLAIAIAMLLGQAVIGFVGGRIGLPDLALAIATALLVGSAVLNARASGILLERRNSETESFGRLLQALSRSVSPHAVIEAIVHEVGTATGADHVAVVQMRPGGTVLEVSFVSMLPGSQTSNSVMPIRQLQPVETRRSRTARRPAKGSEPAAPGSGRAGRVRGGASDGERS